jgi:hypothetical protein
MATSGTVSTTNFTTRQVIDHAFRRCRLGAQQITSEMIDVANDQLYLILSNLANRGVQLWCIERLVMPLYQGNGAVVLPIGTIDVLNTNLRTLLESTGTTASTATTFQVYNADGLTVTTVGIKWSAAAQPFVIEMSNDGLVWTAVDTIQPTTAPTQVSGEWLWIDTEVPESADYFRVRVTSGVLSASEVYFGNTPNEIPIARLNRDDWTALPNKSFEGRPLQFWFDRQREQPVMRLWPLPNLAAETQQIVLWRHRYIQDVGTMTQNLDVPQRWFDAIVAMLASKLAEETPEVDANLMPILEAKADKALAQAENEERDNSPIYWTPNLSVYTR